MLMRRVALQASRCGSSPTSRSWTGFRSITFSTRKNNLFHGWFQRDRDAVNLARAVHQESDPRPFKIACDYFKNVVVFMFQNAAQPMQINFQLFAFLCDSERLVSRMLEASGIILQSQSWTGNRF